MARFAAAGSAAPSRAAGPAAAPSLPPAADAGKLTPLEQQVAALLRHHPGLVLLVECGYKFRFFGRGAVLAARALGIWAHMDRAFMTASVPAFRVGPHVRRLVAAGFAVGVVKQAETAAIKRQSESRSKLFERRLSAVYTRGTLTADALLAAPSGHSQPPASAAGAGTDDEGEEEGGAPAAGDARTGILACVVDLPAAADGAAPGDAAPGISAGAPADAAAAPSPGRKRQRDSTDACPRRTLAVVAVDLATASITWDVFHDDVARTSLTDRLDIIQPHELLLQPEDPSDDPASLRRTRLAAAQWASGGAARLRPQARRSHEPLLEGAALQVPHPSAQVEQPLGRAKRAADVLVTSGQELATSEQGDSAAGQSASAAAPAPGVDEAPPAPLEAPARCTVTVLPAALFRPSLGAELIAEIGRLSSDSCMALSGTSLADLEVLRSRATGSVAGSLLGLMRRTRTAMGARRLRAWLRQPLADPAAIEERLDAVQALAQAAPGSALGRAAASLKGLPDLEAGLGRLAAGTSEAAAAAAVMEAFRGFADAVAPLLPSDGGGEAPSGSDDSERGAADGFAPAEQRPAPADDVATELPAVPALLGRLLSPGLVATCRAAAAAALAMLSAAAGGTGTDPSGAEAGQSEEDKARAAAAAAFGPRGSKGARFAAAAARARSRRVPLTSALSLEAEAAWFPDVAAARLAIDAARRGLDDALAEAAGVLGKPGLQFRSLRTGVSSQLECLVEVSKRDPHRDRVPADWAMVSTTSAVVRYHTPAVLRLLEEQARGRERLQLSCEAAWAKAQAMMTERYAAPLRAAASAAASFDALASLAAVARLPGYCRPLLLGRSHPAGVWATAARHPVAEQAGAAGRSRRLPAAGPAAGGVAITGVYVPNAYAVGDPAAAGAAPAAAADVIREACACVGGGARVTVLTGPNMNGKSSYTRGAALLAVMAQAGSFVPAERCVVSVLDAVFTRMGSTDDLEGGMSTFLVEMAQAASVLREATPRSLVVMDELGRGTATHDGTAIATATLERVVTRLRCPSLFVTHYPELSAAAARLAAAGHSAANAHMAYLDADQAGSAGVVLLYRVQAGAAERSYGLDVARMAGLPAGLLDTAAAFAAAMRRCAT
ncbi:hypothetical protein FNF29_05135 [Cafeteria roenbergensis]|uniref:DNA mismatch repair protein n=1 Tax=Cafeteria roenbergensis TaxID=33653 RepID=A0A5A8CES0_CAFRO|nr:hypothetical protein FNF29_05135 [Cafeteria roenbergensis]|eukprot:KAA0150560.1 hypothetical protein FNF29_05135 [Cafeteria roenbergensis]